MLSSAERINRWKNKYRIQGDWGDATLLDFWQMSVLCFPEKKAVIDHQGFSCTYQELDERSGKLASFFLDQGICPGDFISFQIPGWTEFTIIYIACLKVGAVANPVLPCLRTKDIAYILQKCNSKIFFCPVEYRCFNYTVMLEELHNELAFSLKIVIVEKGEQAACSPVYLTLRKILQKYTYHIPNCRFLSDTPAVVLFTSGTEHFPKGVMLTHNNIIFSERAFTARLNLNYTDKILLAAPTAHAMGFHHAVTASFLIGATSILLDRFNAETVLELIEKEKCTFSMGPSPFIYDMLHILQTKKYDISSLRFFLCGGSPIPRYIYREAQAVGIKMLGVYGATESVPHVMHCLDDSDKKIFSTDGQPLPGIEIKIVDENRQPVPTGVEGEEASRGPNVFVGYLKETSLTNHCIDDDGWYYSGDLCLLDNDGYLRVTGRKKDIIIRGGENLSSVEIEHILLKHDNICESAVIGMPDLRLGEKICAYVVLYDCQKILTLENVKQFFAENKIAKCKWPERIEIVQSLPRTASGKIKKYILKKDIEKKIGILQSK